MTTRLLHLDPPLANAWREFHLFDDFPWFISPHLWTSLAADSGSSAAIAAGDSGLLALTTGATDNNEASVSTTNAVFKFNGSRAIHFEALVQYAEANTDDANIMIGLSSSFGADAMVDNGAGPLASFSGAVFYKVDGGTVWRCRTSVGTAYTDTVLTNVPGGAAQQLLTIEAHAVSLTNVKVTYKIDDVQVLDPSAGYAKPLMHVIDATSAAAMKAGAYVKAGGANSEVLNLDYVGCDQNR